MYGISTNYLLEQGSTNFSLWQNCQYRRTCKPQKIKFKIKKKHTVFCDYYYYFTSQLQHEPYIGECLQIFVEKLTVLLICAVNDAFLPPHIFFIKVAKIEKVIVISVFYEVSWLLVKFCWIDLKI